MAGRWSARARIPSPKRLTIPKMLDCSFPGRCLRLLVLVFVALVFVTPGAPLLAHPPGETAIHSHTHAESLDVITTRSSDVTLPPTPEEDVFHFVIYGDRTGGVPEGLKVLEQAVKDTNLLGPDLVMTVGDLIQGYNETPPWLLQMKEYRSIMDGLDMPWYPVAGNHDVYWRGNQPPPVGHHESNYEAHFGPLWYAFKHKHAGFIVLYSDEGDPNTNEKGFHESSQQQFSEAQLEFLDQALKQLAGQSQVFVFLHHPRWIESRYEGSRWSVAHQKMVDAGNVRAVFAGHIHQMHFGGVKDGIGYYTLATTGGVLPADIPGAGYLHHLNMVTVRPDEFQVASLPVGSVIDPREFTQSFHEDIRLARKTVPTLKSEALQIDPDGSVDGELTYEITNPCQRMLEGSVALSAVEAWMSDLDHGHVRLRPGQSQTITFSMKRGSESSTWSIPELRWTPRYVSKTARISLPTVSRPIALDLALIPADYFTGSANRCLRVDGPGSAVRVEPDQLAIADGPLTLECWIKPTELQQHRGIAGKMQESEYGLMLNEGSPEFYIHLGGKYVVAKSDQKIPANAWSHLAGVFDGAQVRLYVDGQRVDQRAGSGKRKTNRLPFWIGADPGRSGNASRPMQGFLDEVRVSDAAVYGGNSFLPKRRLAPEASTRWLNHFDRRYGPYELSHADGGGKALLGKDSRLEPVVE